MTVDKDKLKNVESGSPEERSAGDIALGILSRIEAETGGNTDISRFEVEKPSWNSAYTELAEHFWEEASKTDDFETLLEAVPNYEYRNYVVMNLEDREITYRDTDRGTERFCGNVPLGVMQRDFFVIRNVNVIDGRISIEGAAGFYGIPADSPIKVQFIMGSIKTSASVISRDHVRRRGISMRVVTFRGGVAINESASSSEVSIEVEAGGHVLKDILLKFDTFAPLSGRVKDEYFVMGGYLVSEEDAGFRLEKLPGLFAERAILKREEKYQEAIRSLGIANASEIAGRRRRAIKKRVTKRKPVWLISDRADFADDNGEALFRYASKNLSKEIDVYFVIRKTSADYERLKKYGRVVDFDSEEHKELALICDVRISSQSHEIFRNPFLNEGVFYRDLLHSGFVVAEHGISYGKDFHSWFNRSNRMIDLVIAGAEAEESIFMSKEYEFLRNEVIATGLPRFDYLENRKRKLITVMPSWRKHLAKHWDNEEGRWILRDDLSESEFACFYRSLLNDERLHEAAREYGYSICVKLHPVFRGYESELGLREEVIIADDDYKYKDIFAESALILTDFSSVVYDFAFLGKPVVYAQFDEEAVRESHTFEWSDYYDYERDGFGEVERDVEGTLSRLIEYMQNDCSLKPEYERRINDFFARRDRNNSRRAIEAILDRMGTKGNYHKR